MVSRLRALAFCLAVTIGGCHAPTASGLGDAQRACTSGASHVEVHLTGSITRYLGTRSSASGVHEGFLVTVSSAPASVLTVEDNVNMTGFIPLRRGDAVELQGQYECNDGVIHWTHHDPAGRHIAGYVIVNGRRFQ